MPPEKAFSSQVVVRLACIEAEQTAAQAQIEALQDAMARRARQAAGLRPYLEAEEG